MLFSEHKQYGINKCCSQREVIQGRLITVRYINTLYTIQSLMKQSKLDHFQKFIQKQQDRARIPISGELQACFDYCQYMIRTEFDKHAKSRYKFKKRKGSVPEDFMRAFNELSIEDKIVYYNKNVAYMIRLYKKNFKPPQVDNIILQTEAFIRSLKLKRWKTYQIRLDCKKKVLYTERHSEIKQFNLGDYIFRGSKNTEYFTIVLEGINNIVGDKCKTIHIGFEQGQKMMEWSNALQLCIDFKHWQKIYIQLYKQAPNLQEIGKALKIEQKKKQANRTTKQQQERAEIQKKKQEAALQNIEIKPRKSLKQKIKQIQIVQVPEINPLEHMHQNEELQSSIERTIVDQLLDSDADNDSIGEIQAKNSQNKKNPHSKVNLFARIFPDYDLAFLEDETNMKMIEYQDSQYRIMQDLNNSHHFKIFIDLPNNRTQPQHVFNAISGPDLFLQINKNLEELQIKTFISSENSAILYMKAKPYNKFYRARDFVFIRHGFRKNNNFYVADHDIDNINFPPFMTIVRGSYKCVWGIIQHKNKIVVVGDLQMKNEGYLNETQNTSLTLNFLKQFSALSSFLIAEKEKVSKYLMFNLQWDISKIKEDPRISVRASLRKSVKEKTHVKKSMNVYTEKMGSKQISQAETDKLTDPKSELQSPRSVKISSERSKTQYSSIEEPVIEVDPKEEQRLHQTMKEISLEFDNDGYVIINKQFKSYRYQLVPERAERIKPIFRKMENGIHPIWNGEWAPDKKDGGLIFIDEKKMEDQKGVLKFVLTKIGKNLLSGKSVLNISLPVDIFCSLSNLQLFTQSMCFAPVLIEPTLKKSPVEKLKSFFTFGLSMSNLYLRMEKPFNPILGQTFQAWINGCPSYAEQISHHPPISALLFYGRGYRIDAQLQSKVQLHMNSGCGTNDGIFRIKYDSGEEICYTSPGGQVSGLTYGDRKFNLVGKVYCWNQKQNLFLEAIFNPNKKGFFSSGKQQNPIDYFQGFICQVKAQFFAKFDPSKRKPPTDNDIVRKLGKIHGIWHKSICFENQTLLNFDVDFPFKMQYQKVALPSDANWREDIAYRRLMQVSKAQTEKQRLEVLQRNDRKLRGEKKK